MLSLICNQRLKCIFSCFVLSCFVAVLFAASQTSQMSSQDPQARNSQSNTAGSGGDANTATPPSFAVIKIPDRGPFKVVVGVSQEGTVIYDNGEYWKIDCTQNSLQTVSCGRILLFHINDEGVIGGAIYDEPPSGTTRHAYTWQTVESAPVVDSNAAYDDSEYTYAIDDCFNSLSYGENLVRDCGTGKNSSIARYSFSVSSVGIQVDDIIGEWEAISSGCCGETECVFFKNGRSVSYALINNNGGIAGDGIRFE